MKSQLYPLEKWCHCVQLAGTARIGSYWPTIGGTGVNPQTPIIIPRVKRSLLWLCGAKGEHACRGRRRAEAILRISEILSRSRPLEPQYRPDDHVQRPRRLGLN